MKGITRTFSDLLGETYSLPETIEPARFKAKKPEQEDSNKYTPERFSTSIIQLHLQRVQRNHGQPDLAVLTRDERTVADEFSASMHTPNSQNWRQKIPRTSRNPKCRSPEHQAGENPSAKPAYRNNAANRPVEGNISTVKHFSLRRSLEPKTKQLNIVVQAAKLTPEGEPYRP